ncbi:MAG: D-alanine--D-alanine ligase [Rhodospirillales bacterium]|nr:D-alanine--D-alanine ligase [Rhodospirillales bacterium]
MKLEHALPLPGGATPPSAPNISFFEFWPDWAFYTPVVAHWLLCAIRYRGALLPTAANPRITSGGLCGESKCAILDQVEGSARALIAPYGAITTDPRDPAADLPAAEAAMAAAGITYPVVVKPDIGCNGTGVRLIQDAPALAAYFAAFPRSAGVVVQEFVADPGEAGIFYIRAPGEPVGRISSVTLKHPATVTGDGVRSLRTLITADPRHGRLSWLYFPHLGARLDTVPALGERVPLVFVGNHCKGSVFENGAHLVTPALTAAIERLARALPDFHFGRFDLRYANAASLARGEAFRVIEINGAGSEATHVWDPATRLVDAWRAQFEHYGAAFRIGAANRARGARPTGLLELWRLWRTQKRLMAAYPAHD